MLRVLFCFRLVALLWVGLHGVLAEEPSAGPASVPPAAPVAAVLLPEEAFGRAVTAYQAGALEEARREFLAIVEGGQLSAALAHDLGNVSFRLGQPGQAVLWYRRALALQPWSPETLQNLRTLRRQQAFVSFDDWGLSLAHLKPRWVAEATVWAAWALVLLLVWLVWLRPRPGRRWPLVLLLLVVGPVLWLGLGLRWREQSDPHPLRLRQVVSGKETLAYAAPAEASSTVMALPAGSEVVPLETRGNWLYCMIPGGEDDAPLRGWVRASRLEALWPYARPL